MIDITLLGTSGMLPLPDRFLTSMMLRYQGQYTLVDCGEGTQIAIRAARLGFRHISTICITHFHADHISGLPGILLTIGNEGRVEPLTIIGPVGLEHVVRSLLVIAPVMQYPLEFIEIDKKYIEIPNGDIRISAQWVEHRTTCYGYSFTLDRQGKFLPDKAKELGVPVEYWSELQQGSDVEHNGVNYSPQQVLGPPREGLKVCYTTDLRPSDEVVSLARNADLFICEGNYGDPEMQDKAIKNRHTTFLEAATMAKKAEVSELWLTHFSPSLKDPAEWLPLAREVFPNTYVDKTSKTISYKD